MDLIEFNRKFAACGSHDKVTLLCDDCGKERAILKNVIQRNISKNGRYMCRSCSMKQSHANSPMTAESKRKISEATMGITRSPTTRKKMANAKRHFYKTPAGEAHKKILSLSTARGHTQNKYENAKRQGWYPSTKTNQIMFYGSSYELRYIWSLDQDDTVLTYETQIGFEWKGRGRCLDVLITYKDGTKKAVEIKPEDRLTEQNFIDQLNDSREHALSRGWQFEVCTEKTMGMTYREIRDWSDEFRKTITGIDYKAHRLEMDRKKAKKHYDTQIATDTVEVYCEFCKTTHTALRLTHDKNIARNGRYICEREGGHIAGSKPKKKKVNPYADQGKKECIGPCGRVLPLDNFSNGKAQCKECRAKHYASKYQEKKNHEDEAIQLVQKLAQSRKTSR